MQNPFKEFLYFSRGERRGILVLITGIILVFLSGYIYIYQREHRPLSDEAIRPLQWQNTNRSSHPYKKRNKNGTTDLILPPKNNRQPSLSSVSIPILPTPSLFADWDCPDGWRGTYSATIAKGGSSVRQKISGKYME